MNFPTLDLEERDDETACIQQNKDENRGFQFDIIAHHFDLCLV